MDARAFGQGPRQVCATCGTTRAPATERSRCGGNRQIRPAVSDYDPFA